ncbi:DUF748 domain-containing protein [Roseateles amylovorans]|uniref:DUF748 domain-containing protein n=1 Tax=Roseateles amylovorans TaxID=2978473 RepID=A0ABY6B4P3_9BURK|nr:DUF748 domain-containing protein [Roseateles amylovorans]UXH80313.1 DUF748 domain-containing protein [Roseateles amylovorans]
MLFSSLPIWPRRVARGMLGLVLLIVATLLIAWFALPLWIERQGVRIASERLGRTVTLEAAHFTPWRLALALEGLRIGGPTPESPALLEVKRIEAALSPRSVLHLAPILSSLTIDTPRLRVAVLAQGHTDLDDVIARLTRGPAADPAVPAQEPDLALYNIQLVGGEVQVDDRSAGMTHRLSDLMLGVPFVSTLDADVDVHVQPRLSGRLNGVVFESEAQAQPFAQTRSASLTFKLDTLDLAAYRAYWPHALPLRLARGTLTAQLTLDFHQPRAQPPVLKLSGRASVHQLALQRRPAETPSATQGGAAGTDGWEDWLRWGDLTVDLADVQPLRRQVLLSGLTLERPELLLGRDAQGRFAVPLVDSTAAATSSRQGGSPVPRQAAASAVPSLKLSAVATSAPSNEAARAMAAASAALAPAPATAPTPSAWRLGIARLDVRDGRIGWDDRAVKPAATLGLNALTLKGSGLSWPLAKAAPIELSATLAPQGDAVPAKQGKTASGGAKSASASASASATVTAKGQLGADGVAVDWALRDLSLGWFADYLKAATPLRIGGQVSAQGSVRTGPQGEEVRLAFRDLAFTRLEAADGQKAVVSIDTLSLDQADIAFDAHRISAGRLLVKAPRAQLARDQAGAWNWQAWLPAGGSSADAAATPAARPTAVASAAVAASAAPGADPGASSPWTAQLAEVFLEGGDVQLMDLSTHVLDDEPARPVGVQELSLRLSALDWDGQQLRKPTNAQLSLTMRRPDATRRSAREAPRLQWEGQIAMSPLRVSGRVKTERLPLHWVDPYLDPSIGIHLQRVEASLKGDFSYADQPTGPSLQAAGDLLLAELRLRQARLQEGRRRSAEDLLSWQALRLNGFKLRMAPARAPEVVIQQAGLDEFYARLIINEQGRLNLRDLRQTDQGQAVSAAAGASSAVGAEPGAAVAAMKPSTPVATDAARVVAGAAPAVAASGPAAEPVVRLSIAETRLNGGQVDFNDRFVKPNYSARLSELTGTLGSFSAGSTAMAPLQLRGRVAGTGLLDVSGALNPSGAPLALDITASATDIELAPLSPYAGKYAGYAIERGKLSSRVHYQIEPGGRLVAENKIVLNQLSFGDRIDSPEATKLPVRLAVALLKDSNGVIDVNLPISGSINDPDFSVGGLIVKLIVNLLTKAVTAPFSLLSGGGSAEMSQLAFPPGTASLPEATAQRLDAVAKILADKPTLQLSITGWVDAAAERRAAQAVQLEEAMLAERRRELRRQQNTVPVAASAPAAASASPARAKSAAGAPASAPTVADAAAQASDAATPADGSAGGVAVGAAGASSAPAGGGVTASPAQVPITLDDAQRQRLLKVVYDNAKLPDKPRNLLGLAKDLPAEQMRQLLMDSYRISDEQMRELALQRSVVVRDALIARGVPNARLFLASPKLHESEAGQGTDGDRGWQPKVDLSLTAQ